MEKFSTDKQWPPKPIRPEDISAEDRAALDVRLETLARHIAYGLDFDAECGRREGQPVTRDTFLIAPPTWPTHGMLQYWIQILQQARALLPVQPEA